MPGPSQRQRGGRAQAGSPYVNSHTFVSTLLSTQYSSLALGPSQPPAFLLGLGRRSDNRAPPRTHWVNLNGLS